MRTVFNALLAICAVVLLYLCYRSIMAPINFENTMKTRDAAVIARLIDIRKAQHEYRNVNNGKYASTLDSLIMFVKGGKIPFVMKEGRLTDKQLEDGLTERKAIAIVEKAKKTGRYDEVKKWGLEHFKRDTMWVAVTDTLYGEGFNADSLAYIPFSGGKKFEIETLSNTTKSGAPMHLYEVRAPYSTYLGDLDKQELNNLIDKAEKTNKYPGLKIGSLESPNNGAGNWE